AHGPGDAALALEAAAERLLHLCLGELPAGAELRDGRFLPILDVELALDHLLVHALTSGLLAPQATCHVSPPSSRDACVCALPSDPRGRSATGESSASRSTRDRARASTSGSGVPPRADTLPQR